MLNVCALRACMQRLVHSFEGTSKVWINYRFCKCCPYVLVQLCQKSDAGCLELKHILSLGILMVLSLFL